MYVLITLFPSGFIHLLSKSATKFTGLTNIIDILVGKLKSGQNTRKNTLFWRVNLIDKATYLFYYYLHPSDFLNNFII